MIPGHDAFTGLGFTDRHAEIRRESTQFIPGFRVFDTAATDQERALGLLDRCDRTVERCLGDRAAIHVPDALLEEIIRVVVSFTFDVLRHRNADSAGVSPVGQDPEGIDAGRHQLLWALDTVPVLADGLECVVGCDGHGIREFELLQNRIRLAGGKGVTRQEQQGDSVGCGCASCRNKVQGTGADRCGHGNNLAAVVLLGIANGRMGHALFVLALVESQAVVTLFEGLADTDDAAMAEDTEDTLDKLLFLAVKTDVLVVHELEQSLSHCQSNCTHVYLQNA